MSPDTSPECAYLRMRASVAPSVRAAINTAIAGPRAARDELSALVLRIAFDQVKQALRIEGRYARLHPLVQRDRRRGVEIV